MRWVQFGSRPGVGGGVVSLTTVGGNASGSSLVVGGRADGSLTLWDVSSDHTFTVVDAHGGPVWGLCSIHRRDGSSVVLSGGADGVVKIWAGKSLELLGEAGLRGDVQVRALHAVPMPGQSRLLIATGDGELHVWDPDETSELGVLATDHRAPVRAVETWEQEDGTHLLATASADGTIVLRELDVAGSERRLLVGHAAPVLSLHEFLAADGQRLLASAGDDGTVRIWDPDKATLLGAPAIGHGAPVRAISSWRPDGRETVLVTGGDDGTLRLWNGRSGRPIGRPLDVGRGQVRALAQCRPQGDMPWFAYAGGNGVLSVLGLSAELVPSAPLDGHGSSVLALAVHRSGAGVVTLVSGGEDGTVRLWEPTLGEPVAPPQAVHTAPVRALAAVEHTSDHLASFLENSGSGLSGVDGASAVVPADLLVASGSDDGRVAVWWPRKPGAVTLAGSGLGPILSLSFFRSSTGELQLACGGGDGRIHVISLATGSTLILEGHSGPVRTVVHADNDDSAAAHLISGGDDGTVRFWQTEALSDRASIVSAHTAPVRVLHSWRRGGSVVVSSGSTDTLVRHWGLATRRRASSVEFTQHEGTVLGLTTWRDGDGRHCIASAGTDRVIRIWDATSGAELVEPLVGHTDTIWALVSWSSSDGATVVASASEDGTIRLWHAAGGELATEISLTGPSMLGMSDRASEVDLLNREILAQAVADQLPGSATDARHDEGPTVITIEGAWGSGKTTFMKMVERRVVGAAAQPVASTRRLTVRQAVHGAPAPRTARKNASPGGVVTAWFNPWTYQSGEQVWAGLTAALLEASSRVLYPDAKSRERYWFRQNSRRLDQYALRRTLRRRVVSPLFGAGAITALVPVLLKLTGVQGAIHVSGINLTAGWLVAALAALLLVLGVAHTLMRYWLGPAANFLPAELFEGPMGGILSTVGLAGREAVTNSPLATAAGPLATMQNGVTTVLRDLRNADAELIVFIDDLDRCSVRTTAEVFESINLFLSTDDLRGRFVVGLDPSVTARRLEAYYRDFEDGGLGATSTSGWDFLRKLVQLPVRLPAISDDGVRSFVAKVLAPAASVVAQPHNYLPSLPQVTIPPAVRLDASVTRTSLPVVPAAITVPAASVNAAEETSPDNAFSSTGTTPTPTALEHHARMIELVTRRLYAQPTRSIREAKRVLNVWQLYARVLDRVSPLADSDRALTRGMRLLVLAEIVTRWPSLLDALQRRIDELSGLQMFAYAIADQEQWTAARERLSLTAHPDTAFGGALHRLLRDEEGEAVAELWALLL